MAITPDGARVYVANGGTGTVSVIDTATNTVIGSPIPVGTAPQGVAITPDGTRVYVANQNSNSVSVIDTATNTVIGSPITVGSGPRGMAITPDGAFAYVTNFAGNTVSVIAIDTAPAVTGTPPAGDVGQPYTFTFTVTGSPTPTTAVTAGTLPPGLALSSTGDLSGTPTAAGSYTFTVSAANGVSPDADIEVTVQITDTPCTGSLCFSSGSSGS